MTSETRFLNKLRHARVLIIGGSTGLGYGVAEACLEFGAYVTISSSNQERINAAVSKLQSSYPNAADHVFGSVCDLGDPQTTENRIKQLFEQTVAKMPGKKLDHVIFTAGDALAMMPLEDITIEALYKGGQVRFFAPLLVAKHAINYLEKSYKSSYTITSGAVSERPNLHWTVIGSFAGGHHSMVRQLALELAPVRCNGISPGLVDTDLWKMGEEEKQKLFAEVVKKTTTQRVGQVEDVVESFVAVLRDHNASGQMIRTDSGSLVL